MCGLVNCFDDRFLVRPSALIPSDTSVHRMAECTCVLTSLRPWRLCAQSSAESSRVSAPKQCFILAFEHTENKAAPLAFSILLCLRQASLSWLNASSHGRDDSKLSILEVDVKPQMLKIDSSNGAELGVPIRAGSNLKYLSLYKWLVRVEFSNRLKSVKDRNPTTRE